jgi:proline-specific peptidase
MERVVEWRGHKTWSRIEGDLTSPDKVAVVALHGGPGLPSDYLEPLIRLAGDGRPVILYDQLGCGNSSTSDDDSMWVMDTFVAELDAVLKDLAPERFVIFGHSWGGWLGLEYVLQRRPAGLSGMILASTCASLPAFAATTRSLKAQLPKEVQDTLDHHEAAGTTDSEEYQAAFMAYATRHLVRSELPESLMSSIGRQNEHIYAIMQGPEWNVTGNLKDWDVTDRLSEIDVPVLVTSGRYDEMTPELVSQMVHRLPDAEWVIFEESAHMAFIEETERFLVVAGAFLARVDGHR